MKSFNLKGKVAIVTGGNGGIGLGMARGLADAGADVAVVGRNEDKSKAAVTELAVRSVRAIAVATDVTDKEAVSRMVEHVKSELGRIDILINNAGINIRKPPQALELEEWASVIDTNLTSAFLCSKAVYPAMKAAGGGKIINIGSMMSIFGAGFAPAYAASKGGIVQFTRACACAWAADNIQANAILPGSTPTSPSAPASRSTACMKRCWVARRRRAGARSTISQALPCFWLRRPPTSSPAPPSPSTAAFRSWAERLTALRASARIGLPTGMAVP
jgi:2-deoxy-D-gluconate 3-dehydrogenase